MTQEGKKSSNKKKIVGIAIGIIVLVTIIVGVSTQIPQNTTLAYVEVDYKTIGWFYDSIVSGEQNNTYFLLNVAITNKGYTKAVLTEPWKFSISIDGVNYSTYGLGTMPVFLYNGSSTFLNGVNFANTFSAVPSVSIVNGSQVSGVVAFELTAKPQAFTLGYSPEFSDFSLPQPQAKIVKEGD